MVTCLWAKCEGANHGCGRGQRALLIDDGIAKEQEVCD